MFRAVVTLLICGFVSSPIWCSGEPVPSSESPATIAGGTQAPVAPQPTPVSARSYVYRIENLQAIADFEANSPVVRRMVDDLVMVATGEPTVAAAWGSLVKPSDVVGIKVCTNGAPLFSSHPAVINAIVAGLTDAGVSPRNIVVWDREEHLLEAAGFRAKNAGYRLMWSEGNYDPNAVLTSPISGKLIYGDLLFMAKAPDTLRGEWRGDSVEKRTGRPRNMGNLSDESHLSSVLTRVVTKVVNVPVLSDNIFCGLSGALFNMTIQNLDNWRRLVQDPVHGDPAIPETYADPRVGDKVVFQIMDGLVALYAGAPIGDANYAVHYGTLYASKDPVALDAVALQRIDQWRVGAQMEPASKLAKYLQTAFSYGLGNADLSKIEVVDVR
ncbi:MAG: DUF362 domain-containing protein [Verrucomicrobia bacterium]|nr:DUF362 domain-containing protein [Verrucomicrobiota bacterium]